MSAQSLVELAIPQDDFNNHIETFYPLGVELLSRDLNPEIRVALQKLRIMSAQSLVELAMNRKGREKEKQGESTYGMRFH
jgi:hypothetical protein